MLNNPQGTLYVLSAPSGAGKTSLVKVLLERLSGIVVSVSHTTRAPRPGEKDGVNYHFIDKSGFEGLVTDGEFLEHAQVFDHYYGTGRSSVQHQLDAGTDVILEIDWQGARLVQDVFPQTVKVFILPPSRAALRERLQGRGQDNDEIITRRMRDAISEMSHFEEYQYLVFNDDFDVALTELEMLISAQRLRKDTQKQRYEDELRSLLEPEDGLT